MLAILTTHPIQYQVPLWQALAQDGRVPFEVWYLTVHGTRISHDPEFGKDFAWDLDTLSGYPYQFLDVPEGAVPGSFLKCRLREQLRERLRVSGARALWLQGWQVAAYWQAVWEAKRAGVEVWLRGESNDLAPTPLWKRAVKRLVLRELFHRVDRFFYIGSANRRLYKKYGVPDDRLFSAPYAVDNDRFAQQAAVFREQRTEIRRQWRISDDAFCLLFCGKFIRKKRPDDLVRATRLLIRDQRLVNVHLLFVGSGELSVALRKACHVMWDSENDDGPPVGSQDPYAPLATFAGFINQTEISKAYVAADCLVLPSDHGETWGLVVNEAMACGLPAIVSDEVGCGADLINPGVTGLLYPMGNTERLAIAIAEWSNHSRRILARTAVREKIASNSIAHTVDRIEEAFRTTRGQVRIIPVSN
jgi:glycosyltransferase involved in cell wall biosynthesis